VSKKLSAALPNGLSDDRTKEIINGSGEGAWSQMSMLPYSCIELRSKLIIDGPAGSLTASVTVLEFSTSDTIAIEVRPGLRFPQDLDLALEWVEQVVRALSTNVAPF